MKIGLAVVTYKRLDYLKQCINSLNTYNWGGAKERVVVDDCSNTPEYESYLNELRSSGIMVIQNVENSGVATSKNHGLTWLWEQGCTDMFLMEDDICMKDSKTCIKYIAYARTKEIQHMSFGLHGVMNVGKGFYNYEGIWCYPECIGAFSYYTREVIDVVGFMDTNFKNAWEHVEHTYRIAQYVYTTPFWQFADHPDSDSMLREIPQSINTSSIRIRDDWQKNIQDGMKYWIKKHGSWLPPRK
jgi:glycosyltransferase involved in cell wall biosynthesis